MVTTLYAGRRLDKQASGQQGDALTFSPSYLWNSEHLTVMPSAKKYTFIFPNLPSFPCNGMQALIDG